MAEAGGLSVEQVKAAYERLVLNVHFWGKSLGDPFDGMKKAAVLVPLVVTNGSLEVWLTKRSKNVRHDKGHICFPGGMVEDSDDTEVDTALREASEEIGLDSKDVEVIGPIVPYLSSRKIFVVPVLALVKESFQPKVNSEVDIAFKIPLNRFLTKAGHRSMFYRDENTDGLEVLHYFHDTVEEATLCTFGLTASILIDVSLAFFKKKPDFEGPKTPTYDYLIPFDRQIKFLSKVGDLPIDGNLSPKGNL